MSALPLLEYGESLAQRQEKGWRQKAPTNAAKLRALLADYRWHDMREMQEAAGFRYGARLLELKREPVDGDSSRWRYRLIGEGKPYEAPPACVRPKCAACGQEVPEVER